MCHFFHLMIAYALLGIGLGASVLQKRGTSETEKKLILDTHNKYRKGVSPNATDMRKMHWDDDLERTAREWISQCISGHDDGYARRKSANIGVQVGQNYAAGPSWTYAIDMWYNEVDYYDYDTDTSTSEEHGIRHYTQVVWSESSLIGCAKAECGTTTKYICNYAYGNLMNQAVYEKGTSCAACPDKCVDDTLCDCPEGKVCRNGGIIHLNNCTCTCQNGFTGETCEICPWEDVYWACGISYGESNCSVWSNVPAHCPVMCGFCTDTCPGKTLRSCQNGGELQQDCNCQCPADYTGELCENFRCPGKTLDSCKNGGKLQDDCTCLCEPNYTGELCETIESCTDIWACGRPRPYGYPPEYCTMWTNVPEECPQMCNRC